MKRDNPFREAIDESLSAVRFDLSDERSVLRAVRSGRTSRAGQQSRRANERMHRRFRPVFACVLTLAVVAPLSLLLLRSQSTRVIVAGPGASTPQPSAVETTVQPQGDPIAEADDNSEIISAARACFERQCDTSVFSFDEYELHISKAPQEDGTTRCTVTMNCVYDNGCSFSVILSMPSGYILQHSTPELATTPTFFDDASDEVQAWYRQYGAYPFTWDAQQQAEFSRRYEGAAIRLPVDGELTSEQAAQIAAAALDADETIGSSFSDVHAYPVLYAERANSDGRARYIVYCFNEPVADSLSDPCAFVTLYADDGSLDSIEMRYAAELEEMM